MRVYKLLLCINSNIDNIVASLESYTADKDYEFQIEHITDYIDLITYNNFNSLDCIIIQEFFDPTNPITVEYLCKFLSFQNLKIICIFDESKRTSYANELYNKCLYNCFFGEDATKLSISELVEIMLNGRNYIEAKKYYNIADDSFNINNKSIISEILSLSKLYQDDEDLLIEEFSIIIEGLSDFEIRSLILQLPPKIIESFLCIPRFYMQYQKVKETITYTERSKKIISLDKINKLDFKLVPVNSKNIGVVSLSQGAGASFFCINFAKALSEFMKVSVIEMPLLKPYMYYYLGLNALCATDIIDFTSFAHLINENKALNNSYYVHTKNNDIYWIISDATKYQIYDWDFTKMMRLIYMPKPSSMNIIDLGDKLFDPSVSNIIEQFYMLIVIIDPMIPNLLNSYEYLEKIKSLKNEKSINVQFVINKYSKGISNIDLIDFLNVKPIAYLPYINPRSIYKAVYDADIPYNNKEVKEELFPEFKKILKMVVPKEIYEKRINKNIFKKHKIS